VVRVGPLRHVDRPLHGVSMIVYNIVVPIAMETG
jgi:hypothetical protein